MNNNQSTIYEIHQINELSSIAPTLSQNDWVLFDIDYTLTEPIHPALQMKTIKKNKQRFLNELAQFSVALKPHLACLMVTETPSILCEPESCALIEELKRQQVVVFGFTALDTSSYPGIGSIPAWREKELGRLGLTFSPNLPHSFLQFEEFAPFRNSYPLFQNGILYCNVLTSKGDLLGAFLDRQKIFPPRLVLIDDALENLQSVQEELKRRQISFLGLHYRIKADVEEIGKISEQEWQEVWSSLNTRMQELISSP